VEHLDILKGVILPYANFIIFFVVLIYIARKPIAGMVTKRRDAFLALVRQSREAKDLAESKNRELTARLAKLDQEIADIRNFTREAAERDAARIVEDANRLAGHLKEEAKRLADAEIERARQAIREEIVAAVKETVTERVKTGFERDSHLKLVQTRISDLKTLRAEGRP